MTSEEARQEWDQLDGLWDTLVNAANDADAGTGNLPTVRAAAQPCRDLIKHIWLRSSPTVDSLISGKTPFSMSGEVSLSAGLMQMIDRVLEANNAKDIVAAITQGKNLIRLGHIYAAPA